MKRYSGFVTVASLMVVLFGVVLTASPVLSQGPAPTPTLGGEDADAFLERARYFAYTAFDTPAAIADASAAIERDPDLLDAYVLRAEQYLWSLMPVQAAADFSRALELEPDSVEARVGRAAAASFDPFLAANIPQAQADLEYALELDPDHAGALTTQAKLIYNVDLDFNQAEVLLSQAIESDPGYAPAYLERALTQVLRQRGAASTLNDLQMAADLFGESPFAYYTRAVKFMDSGQPDAGVEEFQRALERFPNFPLLYFWAGNNAGSAYSGLSVTEQIAFYSAGLEIAPESPLLYVARGQAYTVNREYDQAVADFARALELAPEYIQPHYELANVYRQPTYRDCAMAMDHFAQTQGGPFVWGGTEENHRTIEQTLDIICGQPDDDVAWIVVENPLLPPGTEITVPGVIVFELTQGPGSTSSATLCTTGTTATVLQSVRLEPEGPVYVEIECDGGTGWRAESNLVQ